MFTPDSLFDLSKTYHRQLLAMAALNRLIARKGSGHSDWQRLFLSRLGDLLISSGLKIKGQHDGGPDLMIA